jgi:hypothetical protein
MARLSRTDYYDIADNFAQASAAVLDYRVNTPNLTSAQQDALERYEDELDHQVVMFRNYGVVISGDEAATAQADIQDAVGKAKKVIRKIDNAKRAIDIAAALVTLAGSIAAKDASGIIRAAKGVRDAIDNPPANAEA